MLLETVKCFMNHTLDNNNCNIDIWKVNFQNNIFTKSGERLQNYKNLLSPYELSQMSKLFTEELKKKFIISKASLRIILSNYLDVTAKNIDFKYNRYGKPFLSNSFPKLNFNISHSGSYLLVGISKYDIGLDIEKVVKRHNISDLATQTFSDEENAIYQGNDDKNYSYFYELWVRKEAYIKGLGAGLSIPLKTFTVPTEKKYGYLGKVNAQQHHFNGINVNWHMYSLPINNGDLYKACLAIPIQTNSIKIHEYKG